MFIYLLLMFFVLMIVIPVIILIKLGKPEDKIEEKENKKVKRNKNKRHSISKEAKEDLERKIEAARNAVTEKGFKIVKEIISPIEKLDDEAYLKIAYFDTINKKMIILSMSTVSEKIMLKAYDVKTIVKCELLVNDNEITEETYTEELNSIKLCIETRDIYNPKYVIGLLPKKVAYSGQEVFGKSYIDFAIKVKENIIDMLK